MLKSANRVNLNSLVLIKRFPVQYGTKPAIKDKSEEEEKQIKEFQRISNITRKLRTKLPQKPPFVKNFLLGIFDTDILAYPEIKNEPLNELNASVREAESILRKPEIQENSKISREFLKQLAAGKLLGLQGSQLMDGREMNVTESCRISEVISETNLRTNLLNNEYLGVQAICHFGSDHLRRKYLERLMKGDSFSAFCLLQQKPQNLDQRKRTAILSSDKKSYVLNGQRAVVVNASSADLYIVIAQTDTSQRDTHSEERLTAFVVERDFGGITTTRVNTMDPHLEMSDITFDNTVVPCENIIGEVNKGAEILSKIYPEYRLSSGPVCAHLTRTLINKATTHFINTSNKPNLLYETDIIRSKIGQWTTNLYAMESVTYLTALLLDTYENQDCELESTIVKVFCSEQASNATKSFLDLLGAEAIGKSHWCNQLHTQALTQAALNDANDNLKVVIALFALKHAGKSMQDVVFKSRNALFNAAFVLKRIWKFRRHSMDRAKLNLKLHYYLHPSLTNAAEQLEYCIIRLEYATEMLFTRDGQQIVNKHIDLRRFADCLVDCYVMAACLGRASRSYCIGLQHAEQEMVLAHAFCFDAFSRVKHNLTQLIQGSYQTSDEHHKVAAKRVFKFKEYFPVHPLTRNF